MVERRDPVNLLPMANHMRTGCAARKAEHTRANMIRKLNRKPDHELTKAWRSLTLEREKRELDA